MKRTVLSLLCISALSLAALAQEKATATAPDNSKVNQRDRSSEAKTSGSQSNNKEDIRLTAAIRRAVVKDKALSITAKNIKIITVNQMVTLRGPVKTAQEKTEIAKVAQAAAGGAKIDNQLEVKTSK